MRTNWTISKKEYCFLSGRKRQTLDDQHARLGLPVRGATVNLKLVLSWFHDLLATLARKQVSLNGDDELLAAGTSPALERYREARARLAEYDVQERAGAYVPAELVRELLGRQANVLRQLGHRLGEYSTLSGRRAQGLLNDAIDRAATDMRDFLNEIPVDKEDTESP
jgi:hypothetical protein